MTEPRKVILFRAPVDGEGEEDPYVQKLSSDRCSVCSIPVLAFDFVHLEELATELTSVDGYSGIVFTSRRAVEALQQAIPTISNWSEIKTKWKDKLAFAVGKTTCALASSLGFVPLGEETGNAKNLSSFILEKMERGGKPLLYPCGNLKRETLPKLMSDHGQRLQEIMVYNTSQSPSLEKAISRYLEQEGLPTTLVYFSPSGVRFTWEILHKHHVPIEQLQVVAIGPSTEEELLKYKVPVYGTALKPTPESLFKVLFKDI